MASEASKYIPYLDPNREGGKFVDSDISYEVVSVTVLANATTGSATVSSGSLIMGYYPAGNQDQFVTDISISGTTLTITLGAAATADNIFKVVLLKA